MKTEPKRIDPKTAIIVIAVITLLSPIAAGPGAGCAMAGAALGVALAMNTATQ